MSSPHCARRGLGGRREIVRGPDHEKGRVGLLGCSANGYRSWVTSSLPVAVGGLSEIVVEALLDGVGPPSMGLDTVDGDPLDHDLQLALYVLNELHFAGWVGVDDDLEWNPAVTALRCKLNDEFERRLRHTLPPSLSSPTAEARRLLDLPGPSVSKYLRDHGTVEQVRESMILRSAYQSKEADPHTFAVPRFAGSTKRVLTEIQSGEYGVGHKRSHAELFADALIGLDLDPTPNAHIDNCTGPSLAISNLVTLGAMQRRLRGVVLGQLSLFEMDSVVPNQRMVDCCDRLDLDERVRPFFAIHVLADAEHQVMVEASFLVEYPRIDPRQVHNLLLGMRAQSLIDHATARTSVPNWQHDRSALSVVPSPAIRQAS